MSAQSLWEHLSSAAVQLVPVLLDTAIKGAAILLLAAMATLAMRRASAAARHWVWFLASSSLLALPSLSAMVPGWYVLPGWQSHEVRETPQVQALPVQTPVESAPIAQPQELQRDVVPSDRPPETAPPISPAQHAESGSTPASTVRWSEVINWQACILLAWLAGVVICLGYIALSFTSLWWLERRSSRITRGPLPRLLSQLCEQIQIRNQVDLLSSPRRSMPMTWGLWRTRLLLPEGASTWTEQDCRTVLLHELAHAKRLDCLTLFLTHIVCALHWFNPLIWLASGRMQSERELACDDLVLAAGIKASAYAEQLMHIATEMPPERFSAAAIAMARPNQLESRLIALLDATRNRRTLALRAGLAAVLLIGGVALPLAMVRAENVGKGEPPPNPSPATHAVTAREAEARASIVARLLSLQNLSADFGDLEEFQPLYRYSGTAAEGSRRTFSFLSGNATWEFSLVSVGSRPADHQVRRSAAYHDGRTERLDYAPTLNGPVGFVGGRLMEDLPGASGACRFETGLGLRAGAFGDLDWLTPEEISKMAISFDQKDRPTLSQTQSNGKVCSWTFAPDHGYAVVRYSGELSKGERGEIVAGDFRMVNGIAMPFSIIQRWLYDDGSELIRWTVSVRSYAINDPLNTKGRYLLKWPKGAHVLDVRTGRHVRTTSDDQILDDKTLAALPVDNDFPVMMPLPKPAAPPGVKEMPTAFGLGNPAGVPQAHDFWQTDSATTRP
jgi:beta-lactamase regulating signal transducer with metallopeptidase domain